MKLKVGQDNLEASGIRPAQSKNQCKFPSIPRWDTPLSSETRRPSVSCGNEGQRQAHSRLRVYSGRNEKVRVSGVEVEEEGSRKGEEIERWKEKNISARRG